MYVSPALGEFSASNSWPPLGRWTTQRYALSVTIYPSRLDVHAARRSIITVGTPPLLASHIGFDRFLEDMFFIYISFSLFSPFLLIFATSLPLTIYSIFRLRYLLTVIQFCQQCFRRLVFGIWLATLLPLTSIQFAHTVTAVRYFWFSLNTVVAVRYSDAGWIAGHRWPDAKIEQPGTAVCVIPTPNGFDRCRCSTVMVTWQTKHTKALLLIHYISRNSDVWFLNRGKLKSPTKLQYL